MTLCAEVVEVTIRRGGCELSVKVEMERRDGGMDFRADAIAVKGDSDNPDTLEVVALTAAEQAEAEYAARRKHEAPL